MSRYLRKQITIIFILLAVIALIGAGIYFLTLPKEEPTCSDGIQNQGEEGVDCGAICGNFCDTQEKLLKVMYQGFIPTTENNYDLVAQIENTNNLWGADNVPYTFYLYNEAGEQIASRQGSAYILPQETKYIVEQKVYCGEIPAKVELELGRENWKKADNFRDLNLKFRERNIQTGAGNPNRLYGVLENDTSYNLNKIEIVGVVVGADNKIIAAGKTEMTTLMMGESRYFEIGFPNVISGQVITYEIRPYVNVFSPNAFINVQGQGLPNY